jgi:hypothetical protein
VHKGSTQTNKRSKLGFKIKGAKEPRVPWSGAPDNVRCTRTVQLQTCHPRISLGVLRYNSPDCPVCHQTIRCTSKATAPSRNGRLQKPLTLWTVKNSARRSQSSRQRRTRQWTVPVRCSTELSGATRRQSSNGWLCPNPNGWVTWLAHRTVSSGTPDCPVRPSTAVQPQRLFGGWGL